MQILESIENAPDSILRDTIRYGIDLITLYSFMSGLLVGIGAGFLTRFLTDGFVTLELNFALLVMAIPAIISGTVLITQNNRSFNIHNGSKNTTNTIKKASHVLHAGGWYKKDISLKTG